MRIGIDATAIGPGDATGMGSYSLNLTRSLLELDSGHEFVVYCRGQIPAGFEKYNDKATFRVCRWFKNRKLAEQLWLSWVAPRDRLDVFHCLCSLPLLAPKPNVLTVHGLSWRIFPDMFSWALRQYWIWGAERTMKKATHLIAISQWTQNIITQRVGVPTNRISVVHHGVNSEAFFTMNDPDAIVSVKQKHQLPDRFILFVGSILPIKNLTSLIRAYQKLIADEQFADHHLVIAGIRGWGYDEAAALVKELCLEKRVIFTGKFPAEDLTALYNAAALFVMPSKYEGFGIPLIEAFSCGTPVISSNASCLPEVGGDAAIFFDPQDVDALHDAMARVLDDEALQQRMIENGFLRAEAFTWEQTARQTLEAYKQAVSTASKPTE